MSVNTVTTPITGGLAGGYPDGWLNFGEAEAIAPLGSAQTDAKAISKALAVVTGADGTLGVILPAINKAGQTVAVYSATATNGLKIYPNTSGTINGGSANASITIEGKTMAIFVATDNATNWAAIYTVNT